MALFRSKAEQKLVEKGLDPTRLPPGQYLTETHVDFGKGCYPGQEPIARQHYRGKVNRRLRVLETEGLVDPGADVVVGEKVVGRITSAVPGLALGYVRTEVPDDAELRIGDRRARLH